MGSRLPAHPQEPFPSLGPSGLSPPCLLTFDYLPSLLAVMCTTVCRTGALRVGDRILAINGVALRGRNVEDAVRLLPTNDDSINIKVMRHLSSPPGLSLLYLSITLSCKILYFLLSFVCYVGGLAC